MSDTSVLSEEQPKAIKDSQSMINQFIESNCNKLLPKSKEIIKKLSQKYEQITNNYGIIKSIEEQFSPTVTENYSMIEDVLFSEFNNEQWSVLFHEYTMRSPIFTLEELLQSPQLRIKRYHTSTYFGEIVNNLRHGRGIQINLNGSVFEGIFKSDYKYGAGFEVLKNDGCYHGEYVNGMPEGVGVLRWKVNEIYSGQWFAGKKNGIGKWTFSKGDLYMGDWAQGVTEGTGINIWNNGEIYFGEIRNNLKHGQGHEFFSNMDVYQGIYANGKPQGRGTYRWSNGSIYTGEFVNGLRHGQGSWQKNIKPPTDTYDGLYSNDKKCGQGKYTWSNGNFYQGEFYNDRRNGHGEIYWKDGANYKGQWQEGLMHGLGEFSFEGCSFKGQWKLNQLIIPQSNNKSNTKSITRISLSDFPHLHTIRTETKAMAARDNKVLVYAEDFGRKGSQKSPSHSLANSSIINEVSTRENTMSQRGKQALKSIKKQIKPSRRQRSSSDYQQYDMNNSKRNQQLPLLQPKSPEVQTSKSPNLQHKSIQTQEMKDVASQTKYFMDKSVSVDEYNSSLYRNSKQTQCPVPQIIQNQIIQNYKLANIMEERQQSKRQLPKPEMQRRIQSYSPAREAPMQPSIENSIQFLTNHEKKLWELKIKNLHLNPRRYENIWNPNVINRIRQYIYPLVWMPTNKHTYR